MLFRSTTPPPPSCQPSLSLQRPALEDLLLGSDASITCTLNGLRNPEGAVFTWEPSTGKDAVQKKAVQNSCGCYSVSSVLPGCAERWNSGASFKCTVTHPESDTLTGTIAKITGEPRCIPGTLYDVPCSHACFLPIIQMLN